MQKQVSSTTRPRLYQRSRFERVSSLLLRESNSKQNIEDDTGRKCGYYGRTYGNNGIGTKFFDSDNVTIPESGPVTWRPSGQSISNRFSSIVSLAALPFSATWSYRTSQRSAYDTKQRLVWARDGQMRFCSVF